MARTKVAVLVIIFALSVLSPAQAAEVEELDSGMLFGGLHGLANETIALNSSLNDLPTIAEDYTATWCGQCLAVEDALENVASSSNMQVYSIHRNISDPEDPLGSEAVDAQFRDRFDPYLPWKPPIVGFNGTYAISGNVPIFSTIHIETLNEELVDCSMLHETVPELVPVGVHANVTKPVPRLSDFAACSV